MKQQKILALVMMVVSLLGTILATKWNEDASFLILMLPLSIYLLFTKHKWVE